MRRVFIHEPELFRFDPGKGHQTLLKEFVIERLYEEEKREGSL